MESRTNSSAVKPLETMNLQHEKQDMHASHTDRLSNTAEVVREVSKKIGKKNQLAQRLVHFLIIWGKKR